MKRKAKIFIAVLAGFFFFLAIFYSSPVQNALGVTLAFLNPNYPKDLKNKWKDSSTEFLLHKMKGSNDIHAGIATEILVERKEKAAVPILLAQMDSKSDQTRTSVFLSLAELSDERAIPPMVGIVRQGRDHRDYLRAIDALSIMRYEPVYPEILRMVAGNYNLVWAVDALARFPEKPETVEVLKKIEAHAPESYVRKNAREAITRIESSRGIKP